MAMTYVVAREYGAPIASFEDEAMAVEYAESISDTMGNRYQLYHVPHQPKPKTLRGYDALDGGLDG